MVTISSWDISLSTGAAIIDSSYNVLFTEEFSIRRNALDILYSHVDTICQLYQFDTAFVEDYNYKGQWNLTLMAELQGVVKAVLLKYKKTIYIVSPATLKQYTTGKGNATKDMMAFAAKQRWNFTSKSNNIIDAYALAMFGQDILQNHFTEYKYRIYA